MFGLCCAVCLSDDESPRLRPVFETSGGLVCKKGHNEPTDVTAEAALVGAREWKLGKAPAVGTLGYDVSEGGGEPAAAHWYRDGNRLNWSVSKAAPLTLPTWDHPLPEEPGSLKNDEWLTQGCALQTYIKLAGVPDPAGEGATFGKAGHVAVEEHLLAERPGRNERLAKGKRGPDGFWPTTPFAFDDRDGPAAVEAKHVAVAKTGGKSLASYRAAVREGRGFVEQEVRSAYVFKGPTVEDQNGNPRTTWLDLKGFADVYVTSKGDGLKAPGITDHKFRKSLDFAPDARQLEYDFQLLVYAFFLSLHHPSSPWLGKYDEPPPGVFIEHLNFVRPTKGPYGARVPSCTPVSAFASWENIVKNWQDRVEVSAARLHTLVQLASKGTPLEEIPYNTRTCNAYGGCMFGEGRRKQPGLRICPRYPGAATRRRSPHRVNSRLGGNNTAVARQAEADRTAREQQATQERNKMSLAAALAASRKMKANPEPPLAPEPEAAEPPPAPEPPPAAEPEPEAKTGFASAAAAIRALAASRRNPTERAAEVVDYLSDLVPVAHVRGKSAHTAATFRSAVIEVAGPDAPGLLDDTDFVALVEQRVSIVPDDYKQESAAIEVSTDTIVPPDAAPMTVTTDIMLADATDVLKHRGAGAGSIVLWSLFEEVCKKADMAPTPENAEKLAAYSGYRIDIPPMALPDDWDAAQRFLRSIGVPEDAMGVAEEDTEARGLLSAVYLSVRSPDAIPPGKGMPALDAKLAREAAKAGTDGVSSYTTSRLKKLVAREGEAQGFRRDGETPALAKADGPLGEWLAWDEDRGAIVVRPPEPTQVVSEPEVAETLEDTPTLVFDAEPEPAPAVEEKSQEKPVPSNAAPWEYVNDDTRRMSAPGGWLYIVDGHGPVFVADAS